jgi:hypothetical protein
MPQQGSLIMLGSKALLKTVMVTRTLADGR